MTRKNYEPERIFGHLIVWVVLVCVISFLIIASLLKIDVATRAMGKVVPSKHIQIIENLEGGIIKKVFVKVGDIVQKGQVLVQLDEVRFRSEYEEGAEKEMTLIVRVAALRALAENKSFDPTPEMRKKSPVSVTIETAYYINKQAELRTLKLRNENTIKEVNLTRPLVKEGVMSTVELLRLERDLETIQGAIANWYSTVLNDLNDANDKLSETREKNKALLDRLNRTTVRAPLYGIIKEVYTTTVGGVLKPDDPIIELVPLDDTLLIEALVPPKNIGFIHRGLPARVKITAFDYTIYGQLNGYVENMSADTFKNDKDVSFYKVWVRTTRNYVVFKGTKYVIFPGMEASVDILTGKRTLMHYILKPFMRVRESALIER